MQIDWVPLNMYIVWAGLAECAKYKLLLKNCSSKVILLFHAEHYKKISYTVQTTTRSHFVDLMAALWAAA